MARHMRLDADTGVMTLDEMRAQERASVATDHDDLGARDAVAPGELPQDNGGTDRFGGMNFGACFFGWLVANASAGLLTSMAGAVLAAVGYALDISRSEAEREAGTLGLVAGIVLLVVLLIGYYAGGYVAGRMSRFDAGRQGFGVWVIGLLVTVLVVGLGAVFGTQFDLLDRVDIPPLSLSSRQAVLSAVIIAAVVLGTLVTAILGAVAGHHYHRRVDGVVLSPPRPARES